MMETISQNNAVAGLGYRRGLAAEFAQAQGEVKPAFIEIAPENWIGMGGYWRQQLEQVAAQYPIHSHGLSLSLGSSEELDWHFLAQVKEFLTTWNIGVYSEHLSFCKSGNAHLYDLLPIPFTEAAARFVAERISRVQDYLCRQIAIENVSYYSSVAAEMSEAEFINQVLQQADCRLLLDVNNVYVNAFNHGYQAQDFLNQLDLNRVAYIHMAGHEQVSDTLIIDTHGEAIIDPVYALLDYVSPLIQPVPVLLERDFNFPDWAELQGELAQINQITHRHWSAVSQSQLVESHA